MERRQERSCGLAGHVGGMVGLSLWAHMIGSLISAQLCPSKPTEQQTGCQQTLSCFAESEMRVVSFFFWWASPPFQRAHVLSAGEARRGAALWSYRHECRWWPRLCTVVKSTWHGVQRLASENVCETTQRGPYQDGRKTNEMALSARRGDTLKAAGEEHKTGKRSKINSNTAAER